MQVPCLGLPPFDRASEVIKVPPIACVIEVNIQPATDLAKPSYHLRLYEDAAQVSGSAPIVPL